MTCIAVFSNVVGIGKTSLVYHLGHLLADLGRRVLLIDLDPQAHLTSLCISEERVEALWQGEPEQRPTVAAYGPDPLHLEALRPDLAIVPGDLALASREDTLAASWSAALHGAKDHAFTFALLATTISEAGKNHRANLVLLDLGPDLSAINRAALLAVDFVLTALTPSLQSLEGLQLLGPMLHGSRQRWQSLEAAHAGVLPLRRMEPLGYVVTQTGMRLRDPIPGYARWLARIPGAYRQALQRGSGHPKSISDDPECLGLVHHYAGLMPLALDARKPMFDLRPADGAIVSQMDSVQRCRDDYKRLAEQILARTSP